MGRKVDHHANGNEEHSFNRAGHAAFSLGHSLPKFDGHHFCVGALGAFKNARVVSKLVGRLDGRKQHGQATGWAAALTYWRFIQHDMTRMRHSVSPQLAPHSPKQMIPLCGTASSRKGAAI